MSYHGLSIICDHVEAKFEFKILGEILVCYTCGVNHL